MTPSRDYRKVAAECTKLAGIAPSAEARAGFAAAARSWLMLARLADKDSVPSNPAPVLQPASAIADREAGAGFIQTASA
jgi:hypothetical protein